MFGVRCISKAIGYHSQWGTQNATLVAAGGSGSSAPYFTGATQIYNGTKLGLIDMY